MFLVFFFFFCVLHSLKLNPTKSDRKQYKCICYNADGNFGGENNKLTFTE